jgi:hypothetical protein
VVASASRGKQQGLALLLLLLILIGMTGAFFLVSGVNKSSATLSLARDQKTQAALDLAKQALLSYVATVYAENAMFSTSHSPNKGVPGYFPCPDLPASLAEGYAAGSCDVSGVSTIGKLPWYTLDLDPPRDSSSECLWYAVSGTYKYQPNGVNVDPGVSPTSNMMNWDTPGLFNVLAADGSTFLAGGSGASAAPARAVAVIFAPGPPLPGQNRSSPGGANCRGDYTASDYLETANGVNNSVVSASVNGITQFIAGRASGTFNDRLVYITRDEVWTAIKKRPDFQARLLDPLSPTNLTRKVAQCIASYGAHNSGGLGDKRLPWATPVLLSPMSEYAFDRRYNDISNEMSGRVSYRVNTSDGDTTNDISTPWYLFTTASYCYTGGTLDDRDLNWYSNWKDHLFYALSQEFRPDTGSSTCASSTCVKVNGSATLNGVVVIFAGERLAALNQVRATDADRANLANYLEGPNATNHPNSGGNSNYQSGAATTTFNDLLYCIRQDLSVVPCP